MANATQELTLPTDRDTAFKMLSDFKEVTRWATAERLGELQARFNELDRPPLATQVVDIIQAYEAERGTTANATKAAMDEWFKERGVSAFGAVNRPPADAGKIIPIRNQYARQIEELGFTNLGDFAKEIWHRNATPTRRAAMDQIMNAYSSTDPAAGGFLIPETLDGDIRSLMLEDAIIRPGATVIPMTSPKQLFPFVDWTTNVGSTFGGWTVNRIEEGGTITPSNAKFGRAKLDVTKQVAGAEIPNEMFADVGALDGFIRSTLPKAMAFAEDIDFLTGNGAGYPLGILNEANTALITVAAESNQVASTVITENVLKIYARMLPSSKGRAVWITNPTTFLWLQTLSIAVGTGGAPVMLVNMANGPVPTMLGRPIIETEKVPALGSAGCLSFIDRSYYLIGDRPGSALESSPHQQFMNDITVMKMTARNDGRPWIESPLTPVYGDTLSPFVQLGAVA